MGDGITEKAGQIGRKLHLKGGMGFWVGLAVVGFLLMVMYFTLKPVAASVSARVTAAGQKLKASATGLGAAGAPAAQGGDPRLEGL